VQQSINDVEASITSLSCLTTNRPSSIGVPYPLPFNPQKIPEEKWRNNTITWVNELQLIHNK
jgi:hypothetical protein